MNIGDIEYYVIVAIAVLYLSRRAFGAVGFRLYWGGWILLAVVAGCLVLGFCINWDAVSSFADIGVIALIAIAVLVGFKIVGGLFHSAGREWMYEDNMARWRRRWRGSRNHWWHDL